MNPLSQKLIETASLLVLVFLCLSLTLVALDGNYISIVFILCLAVSFARAKEPYRLGFLATVLLVVGFLLYPFYVTVKLGKPTVKAQPIVYGLLGETDEQLERSGKVAGGCVVTPFSPRWRLLIVLPEP
jgi:hypothetical protein